MFYWLLVNSICPTRDLYCALVYCGRQNWKGLESLHRHTGYKGEGIRNSRKTIVRETPSIIMGSYLDTVLITLLNLSIIL